MSSEPKPSRVLYENLDTSFVNLWGLLRYLSQRSFIGRVHVKLENYSADVFLKGAETPMVHEVDGAAGSDVIEEAALHRLVLRVRESPGSITVFEGEREAALPERAVAEKPDLESDAAEEETVASVSGPALSEAPAAAASLELMSPTVAEVEAAGTIRPESEPATEGEWHDVVRISGELIAGIDQVATATGADFGALFRETRIELADDYTFLDPMSSQFDYANSSVTVNAARPLNSYVAGVAEALRRIVDRIASGERARRTRERVALELSRVARKNEEALARSGFKAQLDRIAGTRVV
ncbi:MAG TPA: hypothetical protein VIU65_01140 [Pyrinomonadaceae bacterium]